MHWRASIGCEDVVDLRPTRLLSGVHMFSIFAEVGMRTTKTGRRAPPFTALAFVLVVTCLVWSRAK